MNTAQHVNDIQNEALNRIRIKYMKGVKEHGGNLWEVPVEDLLENAIDEAIDQVVYLLTLKQCLPQQKNLGKK